MEIADFDWKFCMKFGICMKKLSIVQAYHKFFRTQDKHSNLNPLIFCTLFSFLCSEFHDVLLWFHSRRPAVYCSKWIQTGDESHFGFSPDRNPASKDCCLFWTHLFFVRKLYVGGFGAQTPIQFEINSTFIENWQRCLPFADLGRRFRISPVLLALLASLLSMLHFLKFEQIYWVLRYSHHSSRGGNDAICCRRNLEIENKTARNWLRKLTVRTVFKNNNSTEHERRAVRWYRNLKSIQIVQKIGLEKHRSLGLLVVARFFFAPYHLHFEINFDSISFWERNMKACARVKRDWMVWKFRDDNWTENFDLKSWCCSFLFSSEAKRVKKPSARKMWKDKFEAQSPIPNAETRLCYPFWLSSFLILPRRCRSEFRARKWI